MLLWTTTVCGVFCFDGAETGTGEQDWLEDDTSGVGIGVDVTVDGGTEVDVGGDEIDGEVVTGIGVGVGGVEINTAPTVRTCSAWAAAP